MSRRESEAARLAAQRTKDDAIALIERACTVYEQSGMTESTRTLKHIADHLREFLHTTSVGTEL
ncbi:MAG: hypothetical protein AB7E60_14035 [Sphingobium sp.]